VKLRLFSLLAVFAVLATATAAPAAAADTPPAVGSVLTPGQTGASNPAQWGMSSWTDSYSGGCGCVGGISGTPWMGSPWMGGSFGPWWGGMPLSAISASSGFTWPWAPWYWTPQWWLAAALGAH
jgi:hypothetical protein